MLVQRFPRYIFGSYEMKLFKHLQRMISSPSSLLLLWLLLSFIPKPAAIQSVWNYPAAGMAVEASSEKDNGSHVAILEMDMLILPGTQYYLEDSIQQAHANGAKALIVKLDTPGGMLQTSQEMIQIIFKSPLPIFVYVSPSGGTATSAGVFITMAGHVAAMAPGTSIGAAKPVMGDGKDIPQDMAEKAQNITVAMVKSIAERRGRNAAWAEKAVKESASLTETEALAQGVVDFVAEDIDDLLKRAAGKEIKLEQGNAVLADLSGLERREYAIPARYSVLNVLANPSVIAILWLAATTGISIELYNPGLIFPGVVGVICLILALAMSQIIPVNQAAILLLALGGLLIGAEIYTGTVLLGVLGIVAMIMGALYLVDVSSAPGMAVAAEIVIPVALVLGGFMLLVSLTAVRVFRRKAVTGAEGLVGQTAVAVDRLNPGGKVSIAGELWDAVLRGGSAEAGAKLKVTQIRDGFVLEVQELS